MKTRSVKAILMSVSLLVLLAIVSVSVISLFNAKDRVPDTYSVSNDGEYYSETTYYFSEMTMPSANSSAPRGKLPQLLQGVSRP